MHDFKHGELKSGPSGKGGPVKSRRQTIAIALEEAGASKYESDRRNLRNLRRTERKEAEGKVSKSEGSHRRIRQTREHSFDGWRERSKADGPRSKAATERARRADGHTRQELYAEAQRRHIDGRSKMTKGQLENALGVH
jgi:hypothetical protein